VVTASCSTTTAGVQTCENTSGDGAPARRGYLSAAGGSRMTLRAKNR
jgi:hypothetical protein